VESYGLLICRANMRKNELQISAQILDLNPVGGLLLDARKPELRVICVNHALVELTGFSAAEMIGQPWHHFSAGDCAPVTETVQDTLSSAEQKVPASRILSRHHQGGNDGVQLKFTPVYDAKGKLNVWYAVIVEVPAAGPSGLHATLGLGEQSSVTRKRAGRDTVTGLLDRESFLAALRREWLQSALEQRELSTVIIRVDCFSDYLDVFGKHAGDACLRKIGHAMNGSLRRSGDISARFDDDSFVVLLADTNALNAELVANRISEKVRGLAMHHPRARLTRFLTVSYGVAGALPDWQESPERLLDEAQSKLAGSGRRRGSALSA
jgi:diguanylate cyclase (GGDEF)-like protein/PAS domain S-box-containing protein